MPNMFRKKFPTGRGVLNPGSHQKLPTAPTGLAASSGIPKHERIRLRRRLNLGPPTSEVKICIQRKLGGVGDILMSTPTLRAIKALYPLAEITYATDPKYFILLEANPYIDILEDFRHIDPSAYDFFADITTVCPQHERKDKPPINRIDLFAKYIGVHVGHTVPATPIYTVSEEEKDWASGWITSEWGDRSDYKVIFLSAASIDHRRTWPVEYSHELISQVGYLRKDVRFIVDDFTKRGGDWNHPNTTSKNFGIRQMAALINECDLFVGPDSGPLHIAGALEKHIVALFGPTDPAARINHYKNAIAPTANLGCQHCWYAHCPYDLACMKQLHVSAIQDAVINKLQMKLPSEAFSDRAFVIDIPHKADYKSQLLASGLVSNIRELGYKAAISNKANPEDIVITVLCADNLELKWAPPKGALNCAYIAGITESISIEQVSFIRRQYGLVMANSTQTLETLRANGLGKLMYQVDLPLALNPELLGPVQAAYRVISDITPGTTLKNILGRTGLIIDMNPNSDGILATQALVNGTPIVIHEDVPCPVPNSFITRCNTTDWHEFQEHLVTVDEQRLEDLEMGARWARENLGKKPTHTLLNLVYNSLNA